MITKAKQKKEIKRNKQNCAARQERLSPRDVSKLAGRRRREENATERLPKVAVVDRVAAAAPQSKAFSSHAAAAGSSATNSRWMDGCQRLTAPSFTAARVRTFQKQSSASYGPSCIPGMNAREGKRTWKDSWWLLI